MLAVAAADRIGIPIAPLVAGLGVGGLAIALAVRPTLENVIGGLTLFADRPVRVGDFCRYGDSFGTIERIGLRSTRIRTIEQSLVTVPNSEFSQLHLDNLTERTTRLLRTVLQVRQDTTPAQLRLLLTRLRELLVADPAVVPDTSHVRFTGYGVNFREVEVFAHVLSEDEEAFLATREAILLSIEEVLHDLGSGLAATASEA
jgi:MscS family membrane protein